MKYIVAFGLALLFSCSDGRVAGVEEPTEPTGGGDTTTTTTTTPPPPPSTVFEAEVVKGTGDRFDPVLIDVSYTLEGEEVEWDFEYSANLGHVERTDTGLAIYSDGRYDTGQIVINDEEYQYQIVEEPVCEISNKDSISEPRFDCMGYQVKTGAAEYIYYGEDDTRIVEWEILFIGGMRVEGDIPQPADKFLQQKAEAMITESNRRLAQSGVFVRLKLVGVFGVQNPNAGTVLWPYIQDGTLPFPDFIAVQGAAAPGICGTSGVPGSWRNRTMPLRFLNACGVITFLHEMGHSSGLGHGQQQQNPGSGSNFLFAQGGPMCGYRSDIMQYGGSDSSKAFTNHKRTCGETFDLRPDQDYYDYLSGSDDPNGSSTAYALNRVRYDISMVNDERSIVPKVQSDAPQEEEIIIVN